MTMSERRYQLVTPARRGRTGFRSRTHLALKQGRKKMPQSLCRAENNTPRMENWPGGEYTLDDAQALRLGTKELCKNCISIAQTGGDDGEE